MPDRRTIMRSTLGAVAATTLGATSAHAADVPVATTASGKIRGAEQDGITIFKGVPYAAARRLLDSIR